MKNAKYIVNSEGERISVIISTRDSVSIQAFLREQLALSVLDSSIKYLDVSHEIKGKKKYPTLLFRSLAHIYLEQTRTKGWEEDYKVTKTQPEIADYFDVDKKNIQTQCNDILEPYMQSKRGKAVVDVQQHNPGTGLGTTYTLNFLKVINNAINEFLEKANIEIYELIDVISDAKNYQFPYLEDFNNCFKQLMEILHKHLDRISSDVVYEKSPSAEGSRKWQKSK